MSTFSQWLQDQAGRADDIGIVALTWKDAPDRPRISGVKSIGEWVAARVPEHVLPPDRVNQALLRAGYEYREVNAGRTPHVAAVPDPPAPGGIPAGQPMVPADSYDQPSPAVMAALGRIERMIAELAPLVELAREVQAGNAAAQQANEEAGLPPAADPADWYAENAPGLAEQALAVDEDAYSGAEMPPGGPITHMPDQQPAGFYGAQAAPMPVRQLGGTPPGPDAEPDWAALAELGDPSAAE